MSRMFFVLNLESGVIPSKFSQNLSPHSMSHCIVKGQNKMLTHLNQYIWHMQFLWTYEFSFNNAILMMICNSTKVLVWLYTSNDSRKLCQYLSLVRIVYQIVKQCLVTRDLSRSGYLFGVHRWNLRHDKDYNTP